MKAAVALSPVVWPGPNSTHGGLTTHRGLFRVSAVRLYAATQRMATWRVRALRCAVGCLVPFSSAEYSPLGAINASGSRARHHAFAHGRSRAAIRPTVSQLLMLWTAPTTGIAICQNAVAIADRREVMVGKRVAPLPPRRSRRALLTHRAPPSGYRTLT